MPKTGVLLINLGTPDSPTKKDVYPYLTEFLNDPRVIDVPWLQRKLLVNAVIIPFRISNSTKIYQQLWTKKGSPLLIYGYELREELQKTLGDDFGVHLAMRYQNPSLEKVLAEMQKENYGKIIIVPLFPQYASSSTGSAVEKAMRIIKNWWVIPELSIISQFWDNEGYINTIVERAKEYDLKKYEHFIFSYHGLPERQVNKVHLDGKCCKEHNCKAEINDSNQYCYRATCYATTRLLAERLGINEKDYTVSFQSRLNNKWLEPFSDEVVEQKAKEGVKNLLVFSPAFVADCLETTVEIGIEYKELFQEKGGEKLDLVKSLNVHPLWVEALKNMVLEKE